MRKIIIAVMMSMVASVSMATLVVYDSFNDPVSSNAVPTGWSLYSGTGHGRIDAGSLSYAGMPESQGNSFGLGQQTGDYRLPFSGITGLVAGDTVYCSFLLRLNSPLDAFNAGTLRLFNTGNGQDGGIAIGWGTADPTFATMGFSLASRNNNYVGTISVTHSNTPQTYTSADTTYLIVMGYNRGTNAATSSVDLWINPDTASFSGSVPASTLHVASYVNATDYTNLSTFNALDWISNGGGSGVPNWQIDELRIGRTWEDMISSSTGAPVPPVASFTHNPTNGIVSIATFSFTDTSTGSITNRHWDFGDGTTTNLAGTTVQHIYNTTGLYTVALTVSGPAGSDTSTEVGAIDVLPPVMPAAAFTPAKVSGYAPLIVAFTDSSTGTITNRYWDFGDGNTSNTVAATISHTYAAAGSYTVALTVSGPAGSDTDTQTDLITVENVPEGTFVVTSEKADVSIGVLSSNGTPSLLFSGESVLLVADNNYQYAKAEACAIVVFRLPDLGGKSITSANLAASMYASYPGAASYPMGIDLYGVRYASSSTVLTNDYGNNGSGSGILIQDNLWSIPSSAIYDWTVRETDVSGDAALLSWIEDQYTAGAVAGDYIFLRYESDALTVNPCYITSADSTTNQPPVLTLVAEGGGQAEPPPTSLVSIGTVGGGQDVISWTTAQGSGYVYSVWYSTNLLAGFQPLATNLADTVQSITNIITASPVFYQIKAQ